MGKHCRSMVTTFLNMINDYSTQPSPKPVESPTEPQSSPEHIDNHTTLESGLNSDLKLIELGKGLGLDDIKDIRKYESDLSRMLEWASSLGVTDMDDILFEIKKLSARIGSPVIGDNKLKHLSRYMFFQLERNRLDQKMKQLEDPSI